MGSQDSWDYTSSWQGICPFLLWEQKITSNNNSKKYTSSNYHMEKPRTNNQLSKKCHTHTHENKKTAVIPVMLMLMLLVAWPHVGTTSSENWQVVWGYHSGRMGGTAQWAEESESPWWNLPTRTHLIHKDATLTTDAYLGVWGCCSGYEGGDVG